jgi:hypothetical protein
MNGREFAGVAHQHHERRSDQGAEKKSAHEPAR